MSVSAAALEQEVVVHIAEERLDHIQSKAPQNRGERVSLSVCPSLSVRVRVRPKVYIQGPCAKP